MVYNIISCSGFSGGDAVGYFRLGGDCIVARLSLVILFFIFALINKWVAEPFGIPFSLLGSTVSYAVLYLILISLTGSIKISLIVGLLAGLIGGYMFGLWLGDGE